MINCGKMIKEIPNNHGATLLWLCWGKGKCFW